MSGNGQGECFACNQGYNLKIDRSKYSCVKASCSFANCLECSSTKCTKCAQPYVASPDGLCVCNFQNCMGCSSNYKYCDSCPTPLISTLLQPNCVPQPSLKHTCTLDNCKECIDSSRCSKCAKGYKLNFTTYQCVKNNFNSLKNC